MEIIDNDDLVQDIEASEDLTIPEVLPVLPVRDVVIFKNMLLPLFIGRTRSIKTIEESIAIYNKLLFVVSQNDPEIENPEPEKLYNTGTVSRILRILKLPDQKMKLLIQGVSTAKIDNYTVKNELLFAKIDILPDNNLDKVTLEIEATMRSVKALSTKILELRGELSEDISSILNSINEPGKLADLVASNLTLKLEEFQKILESSDSVTKLNLVNKYLTREVKLSSVQAKISDDVQKELSKTQRDYYLREHLRAIHKELGDFDEKFYEIDDYSKQIKKAKMPKEAEEEVNKQLKRLDLMQIDSSEATIIRTYIDYLLEIPWSKSTKDFFDINYSKKILDKEHYGLEKIKDRILEYLSVKKLNPKMKGPILCFVGPPGVGKTSLGKAISKAIKRKFVRISLGGINDEAEIRGHRRTYIGAMPGRIIQGIIQAKTNNPVFMMDEIDKLGSDFRGDPSSALLEVLDPEQNFEFYDHYLNIKYDLSKVIFIMTANIVDNIPQALHDRMEIINLSGYTDEEKINIANNFLIPRELKETGLLRRKIKITSNALLQIINEYTLEAGVRCLQREINTIFRKIARKIAEKKKGPFNITKSNLHLYLGVRKYYPELEQDKSEIGVSIGLAWTQSGGEPLYVEALIVQGKGELVLTGQIGEVMQESAKTAVTYTRANFCKTKKENQKLDNSDIHIHVPACAIPKDGPSAGIAIACAIVSILTKKPVNKDVAMTGEISLRGKVLPVGGLKEKSLGALRAGVKTVIIPKKNEKDLQEIPIKIRKQIKYIIVEHMDEVLKHTLL